jgi:ubiquitin-protein ligase
MSGRLNKELAILIKTSHIKCQTVNDDLYHLKITIDGPKGTPYEGGKFVIDFKIPVEYPFKPPEANFDTKIHHPNVLKDGHFCLKLLVDEWSPQTKIIDIINEISSMLKTFEFETPANIEVFCESKCDFKAFEIRAKKMTEQYAK